MGKVGVRCVQGPAYCADHSVISNPSSHLEPDPTSPCQGENNFRHTADRVDQRLTRASNDADILNLVLSTEDIKGIPLDEMHSNANIFDDGWQRDFRWDSSHTKPDSGSHKPNLFLGCADHESEFLAFLLSGLTYQLMTHPYRLNRLRNDTRSAFSSIDNITLASLSSLKNLNACKPRAEVILSSVTLLSRFRSGNT